MVLAAEREETAVHFLRDCYANMLARDSIFGA